MRGGGERKGQSGRDYKEVSADYKAEPEDLKLSSKITGPSNERKAKKMKGVII